MHEVALLFCKFSVCVPLFIEKMKDDSCQQDKRRSPKLGLLTTLSISLTQNGFLKQMSRICIQNMTKMYQNLINAWPKDVKNVSII